MGTSSGWGNPKRGLILCTCCNKLWGALIVSIYWAKLLINVRLRFISSLNLAKNSGFWDKLLKVSAKSPIELECRKKILT